MNECLLCGKKIADDKLVCKDCWDEGHAYWEENDIDFYDEYKSLLKEAKRKHLCVTDELIRDLTLNAIAYYYENDRDMELLDRVEEDLEDIEEAEELDEEDITSQCVICGEEANGWWFCPNCYKEYKNKELVVKFTRCIETEVLDSAYENTYICDDGHRVKSKSEQAIDNWLYHNKIWHVYEKEFQYGDNEKILPDFYLPEKDVYIEHWGLTDDYNYRKQMEKKLKIYRKEKVTLICTYENKDGKNIHSALEYKLKHYKNNQINFEEK